MKLKEQRPAFWVECVENPSCPEFEGKPAFGPAPYARCAAFMTGFKWWRGGPGDDGEYIVLKIVKASEG